MVSSVTTASGYWMKLPLLCLLIGLILLAKKPANDKLAKIQERYLRVRDCPRKLTEIDGEQHSVISFAANTLKKPTTFNILHQYGFIQAWKKCNTFTVSNWAIFMSHPIRSYTMATNRMQPHTSIHITKTRQAAGHATTSKNTYKQRLWRGLQNGKQQWRNI